MNHADLEGEFDGLLVRAYHVQCAFNDDCGDWCIHYHHNATKRSAERSFRKRGWSKTITYGWVCPYHKEKR